MAVCHALSGLDVMNRTQRRQARLPPGSPVGSLSLPSSPGPRDQHALRGCQARPGLGCPRQDTDGASVSPRLAREEGAFGS